jgi:hypothetical protein
MTKTLYILWTEDNELTPRRKNNLEIIKEKCGVELKFLNHSDIPKYELADHKFHEAYQYLSATHKSDYLRSYLMHFYGGGYCDLKRAEWDWNEYFDELEQSDYLIMGYTLSCHLDVAVDPLDINKEIIINEWQNLIGFGAMICKPRTELTDIWFTGMTLILDQKFSDLQKFPAVHIRDKLSWVTNSGYPLRWAEIGGTPFMQSCFKFKNKLNSNLPCPKLNEKYR